MEKVKLNPKRTKKNINISSVIHSIRRVKASNSVETNNPDTRFKKKGKSNRNSDSKILFLFNNKHTKTKPSTTIEDINHGRTKDLNQNSNLKLSEPILFKEESYKKRDLSSLKPLVKLTEGIHINKQNRSIAHLKEPSNSKRSNGEQPYTVNSVF